MIKNILLVTLRSILGDKQYALINVFGLVMGLAAFLFIAIYVIDELSFDKHHSSGDRIYRVALRRTFPGGEMSYATTPTPLGEALYRDIPEVESFTRVSDNIGEWRVKNEQADREFYESNILLVDSNFFEFFNFASIYGSLDGSLEKPRSLVLTRKSANRFFGDENPVGKFLIMQDTLQFEVLAVVENPSRTHLQFDFLISSETFPANQNNFQWVAYSIHNYIKLDASSSALSIESKFPSIVKTYVAPVVEAILGKPYEEYEQSGNFHHYYLQPLTDIHLTSDLQREIAPNSSTQLVNVMVIVAFAILILVSINYVNLTTSKSLRRAKEVGIRKIYGSTKWNLGLQFLVEAFLFTLTGVFISVLIVIIFLPQFSSLIQRDLTLLSLLDGRLLMVLCFAVVLISFLSGVYPAFYVASFQPVSILKGEITKGVRKRFLRNGLVVVQFMVSVIMIVGTLTIVRQVQFMMTKDLGFERNNLLVLERVGRVGNGAYTLKTQLEKVPGVVGVSSSNFMPGRQFGSGTFEAIGMPSTERHLGSVVTVEYDFLQMLGTQLIDGRYFSSAVKSDTNSVMVNETLVRQIGWENPIGEKIKLTNGQPVEIVGVISDLHLSSLREQIEPTIIFGYEIDPQDQHANAPPYFFIRIDQGREGREVIDGIEQVWNTIVPDEEMHYMFFDTEFNRAYENELQYSTVFGLFSVLAVAIALIGIIGLSSFTIGQRLKEIAVRKVLGASTFRIIVLLSRTYLVLVIAANIIAIPLGVYVIEKWLNAYPYRISLPLDVFIITVIVTVLLVVLVTLYQSIKASVINPIISLRNE